MTGLFCRIQSLLQDSFAKETFNFKEPTNRSNRIEYDGIESKNTCTRMHINTSNYRSLLQNSPIKETIFMTHQIIGLFCKRAVSNVFRIEYDGIETKHMYTYGVATMSRHLKIIGLFCRTQSLLQGSFAKETCNFKEPTNRSHPICT